MSLKFASVAASIRVCFLLVLRGVFPYLALPQRAQPHTRRRTPACFPFRARVDAAAQTFTYGCLCGLKFSFLWVRYPGEGRLSHLVIVCLTFKETFSLCVGGCAVLRSFQQYKRFGCSHSLAAHGWGALFLFWPFGQVSGGQAAILDAGSFTGTGHLSSSPTASISKSCMNLFLGRMHSNHYLSPGLQKLLIWFFFLSLTP